jgi:integrase
MAAEPTPEAIAHSVRFRKVSSRYPRQVADAYREVFGDYALAMEDTDEQVAGVVAAWGARPWHGAARLARDRALRGEVTMPAEQRGEPYRTRKGWGVRFYAEDGSRRRQSGFTSRSAALAWFRDVESKRQRGETPTVTPPTFEEHVEAYLEAHAVGRDPKTIDVLRFRLAYATSTFGELRLDELERRVAEVAAWTTTLPAGSRYGIVQALRQCLEAATRWGLMRSNPAKLAGRNPQPRREEVEPFEPEEVERIAEELGTVYGPLVIVAAYTGLRPSEWAALEWRDVDRAEGVLRVERAYSYGVVKSPKTKGSRRRVPLPARASGALEALPRRLDTRLVSTGPVGTTSTCGTGASASGSQRSNPPGCGHGRRRDRQARPARGLTTCSTATPLGASRPASRPTT